MRAISPGVYARLIPLGSYVSEIPGDNGFICVLSDKGPDNKLSYVTSQKELIENFGNPNYNKYKRYANGMLVANNFIQQSGSLYVIRVMPPDATYANVSYFITKRKTTSIASANVSVTYGLETRYVSLVGCSDEQTISTLVEALTDTSTSQVNAVQYIDFIPDYVIENGGTYKVLRISNGNIVTVDYKGSNPVVSPIYTKDSASSLYKFNSTTLKFEAVANATVAATDSLAPVYIKDVNGTAVYRVEGSTTDSKTYTTISVTSIAVKDIYDISRSLYTIYGNGRGEWYNNFRLEPYIPVNESYPVLEIDEKKNNVYYNKITLPISFTPGQLDENGNSVFISDTFTNYFTDLKVYLNEDNINSTNHEVLISILQKDNSNNYITPGITDITDLSNTPPTSPVDGDKYFVLNNASGDWFTHDGEIATYNAATSSWTFSSDIYPVAGILVKGQDAYIHTGFGKVIPFSAYTFSSVDLQYEYQNVDDGSDGSLISSDGIVDNAVTDNLLVDAYSGITDPSVTNIDNYWFDLVFDAGYSKIVKDAIVTLVNDIRKDCIAIMDLTDQPNESSTYNVRIQDYPYDSMYVYLYAPFVQIYDAFDGRNVWVSPVYELAKLIPESDKTNYVWYAVAGETRGAIDDVSDMRFNPNLSDRDLFYLNQINPIVKFKDSPTMVYGQLSSQRKPAPTNNMNVVRTSLYIERALKQYCKRKLFDFNDSITYEVLESDIKAFLKEIKDERGLVSYSVKVSASEFEKKNKSARVQVRFEVNGILEKIYLDLYVS